MVFNKQSGDTSYFAGVLGRCPGGGGVESAEFLGSLVLVWIMNDSPKAHVLEAFFPQPGVSGRWKNTEETFK